MLSRIYRATLAVGLCVFQAGVLLVPSTSAQAVVVTRSVDVTLNATTFDVFDLDVDLNGTTDFIFTTAFDPTSVFGFAQVTAPFGSSNGVAVDAPSPAGAPNASRLDPGALISSALLFSNGSFDQANLFSVDGITPSLGNFGGTSGFLGLQFASPAGLRFGFAEVSVNDVGAGVNPLGLTIGTVGFSDVVGQALAVPSAVPEPHTLSLLAVAFVGLVLGGRRRARRDLLVSPR